MNVSFCVIHIIDKSHIFRAKFDGAHFISPASRCQEGILGLGRPNLNKDFLERPGQPEGLRVPGGENVVMGVVRGFFFGGENIEF